MAKKKQDKNKGLNIICISFLVIFIAELFLFAWCRIQCIKAGYDISKKTDEQKNLLKIQNSLKIEIAHLKSYERISGIAKKLGLVAPNAKQTIILP